MASFMLKHGSYLRVFGRGWGLGAGEGVKRNATTGAFTPFKLLLKPQVYKLKSHSNLKQHTVYYITQSLTYIVPVAFYKFSLSMSLLPRVADRDLTMMDPDF